MDTTPPIDDPFERRYQRESGIGRHIEVRDLAWANILPRVLAAASGATHFLDIGSGTGAVACLVAAQGVRVTALDRAASGVSLGNAQAAALGVTGAEFRQWDLDSAEPLPVDAPVDVAFASEILEHVADDRDVLIRVRECMSPGARLLATSPSSSSPMHRMNIRLRGVDHMDVMRHHLRRYSAESFHAVALGAGFTDITVVPISGIIRDLLYGSQLGLRATRFVKRPLTPVVEWLDCLTIPIAESQLLLDARVPSLGNGSNEHDRG